MKRRFIVAAMLAVGVAIAAQAQQAGQTQPTGGSMHAGPHVLITPDAVKWGPASPALPAGAEAAILYGDPSVAGEPFVVRLKFPDGYKIAPHWHPTDEYVTVLKGTLMMGVGEKFEMTGMKDMPAGTFGRMPKETRHFASAKGDTLIQLNGVGPFAVTYVNAADDPRTKKGTD
jgi:anti-sigma factor ChrR (cupin superfamily)